jgi:N-acyl-D-aspartate/D-glutamate deacylase
VFDGLGNAPKVADVGIKDGKVVTVAPNLPGQSAREIEAQGHWVMPGMLDIHTHYDAEIEVMPGLEESVRHGVTTIVMGNCSLSTALGSEEQLLDLFCRVENLPRDVLSGWLKDKITWRNLQEYYDHLETLPVGPNVASFLGHSNVRFHVMGLERSLKEHRPSADEVKKMQHHVHEAMDAGYLGLSIDMLPWHRMDGEAFKGISIPSQQARGPEYRALAEPVRQREGVLQATPNAISRQSVVTLAWISSGLGRKPLRTTIVAALDVKTDPKIHRLATFAATMTNKVLGGNMRFQALAEPFLVFGDGPIIPFFEELDTGMELIDAAPEERKRLMGDPAFRARFRKEWESTKEKVFHCNLADMYIVSTPTGEHIGQSFADAAKALGKEPVECFMDMMAEWDTDLRWKSSAANDRDKARKYLLGHKYTLPGFNDSGAHARNMGFQDGGLQMLKQAIQDPDWISPEMAIKRLTSEPAEWLGIEAGVLNEGARADFAVIDPERLKNGLGDPVEHLDDRMGGSMRMVKRTDGVVKAVGIAGKVAWQDGGFAPELGQERFGQLLKRKI